MTRFTPILALGALGALAGLLVAPACNAEGMKMPMPMSDTPAHFKVVRAVYTTDHRYLVKLLSLPAPIPYQEYFRLRLTVFSARPPHAKLPHARVEIKAGMRHGLKHGFAHGMDSAPRLATRDGVTTVSGMFFHMMGPWVLKATVHAGGKPSTAYFKLPCCGK